MAVNRATNDWDPAAISQTTRAVAEKVGSDNLAHRLLIDASALGELLAGDTTAFARDETLGPRLSAWIKDVLPTSSLVFGRPSPPFDHTRDFWSNFYAGPRTEPFPPMPRRPISTIRLLDFNLNSTFGVPACALTPNASYVGYFAELGFDLITYKTVRDQPRNPHPFPQWAAVVDFKGRLTSTDIDNVVVASTDYWPVDPTRASLVNSFGVPSLPAQEWQEDIQASVKRLGFGQALLVSVMGSPETAATDDELVAQFVKASDMAVEAGANGIEVNLSCPNSGQSAMICESPELSRKVVEAVSKRLSGTKTPLFMKISYMPPHRLEPLLMQCGGFVQGISAINTVSVPVVDSSGGQFFSGHKSRYRAGLSGFAIKDLGLGIVRQLVATRDRERFDYVVVGIGGIMTPEDYDDYLNAGADAAQSCSGAWLDPSLAVQIRAHTRGDREMALSADTVQALLDGLARSYTGGN